MATYNTFSSCMPCCFMLAAVKKKQRQCEQERWRWLSTTTAKKGSITSSADLLRWCAQEKALLLGRAAHHRLITEGLDRGTYLANLVLHMYSACGALSDARSHFDQMQEGTRNEYTWRIMILAYTHADIGHSNSSSTGREVALHLFQEMQAKSVVADRLTFITLIVLCSNRPRGQVYLDAGKRVHYLAFIRSLDSDLVLGNALISMYAKHNCIQDARSVFDHMQSRDVVSWNALITAYSGEGQWTEAMKVLKMMIHKGFIPDRLTFIGIFTALTSPLALEDGMSVHNLLCRSKYKHDVAVNNALLSMYGKCGNSEAALKVFDSMVERDIITWTTILALHAEHEDNVEEAFQCYEQLQQECMAPTIVTSVKYLDVCASRVALCAGKRMHAQVMCFQERLDVVVQTALISMYGRCARFKSACTIFYSMHHKNMVTWGAMVAMYAHHAHAKEAMQLLEQMQQECNVPDRAVFASILDACAYLLMLREGQQVHARIQAHFDETLCIALIKMYAKHKRVEDAECVFNSMSEHNVLAWNAKVASYSQFEDNHLALQLFGFMQQESVMPDKVTFVTIIAACGAEMDLQLGKQIHAIFIQNVKLQHDVFLWNALVSMYGRCGDPAEAHKVFDRIPEKNDVSWNALMAAYAQNGNSKESLYIFHQMETQITNLGTATFSVLLSACSHGGLVSEAFSYFQYIVQAHSMEPVVEHYNCLLDLLARAGLLVQAGVLLESMPCTPNIVSLATMLGACRFLNDVERGEYITLHMFHMDPCNAVPFVILSNIYASAESHVGGVPEMLAYIEGIT